MTEEERQRISQAAEYLGTTDAYVVRLVVRKMLSLPVGGSGETDFRQLTKIKFGHVQNLTRVR